MVNDNDLGLGFFTPISARDRENVRKAQMLHIVVSEGEREAILEIARAHPQWRALTEDDHDMRVFNAITMDRFPASAPSLLDVCVVMAAMRANHLS
jgi:hypothetical protein